MINDSTLAPTLPRFDLEKMLVLLESGPMAGFLAYYSNLFTPNGVIPDRREPYRRVPLGRVHLDERRLDEDQ